MAGTPIDMMSMSAATNKALNSKASFVHLTESCGNTYDDDNELLRIKTHTTWRCVKRGNPIECQPSAKK